MVARWPLKVAMNLDAEPKIGVIADNMQQSDLEQWLPGVTPGDIASSPLNPILW